MIANYFSNKCIARDSIIVIKVLAVTINIVLEYMHIREYIEKQFTLFFALNIDFLLYVIRNL